MGAKFSCQPKRRKSRKKRRVRTLETPLDDDSDEASLESTSQPHTSNQAFASNRTLSVSQRASLVSSTFSYCDETSVGGLSSQSLNDSHVPENLSPPSDGNDELPRFAMSEPSVRPRELFDPIDRPLELVDPVERPPSTSSSEVDSLPSETLEASSAVGSADPTSVAANLPEGEPLAPGDTDNTPGSSVIRAVGVHRHPEQQLVHGSNPNPTVEIEEVHIHVYSPPQRPIGELEDILLDASKENALRYAHKTTHAINLDRTVKTVDLQISSEPKKSNNHGHYNTRREIIGIYQSRGETILIPELFPRAKEAARLQCQLFDLADAEKELFILKNGNIVGIIGQAGIGKTTLTRIIAGWVLENRILFDTRYIFILTLRDVDYGRRMNVLEFLTTCWSERSTFDDESETTVKSIIGIIQQSSDVLIIMDGLDEAIIDNNTRSPKVSIYSDSYPADIINNLLRKDLLPKSRIITTSRQRQMYELHPESRPLFIAEVKGLSLSSQIQICRDICGPIDSARVLDFLENRPDIQILCYVPVTCILIIVCVHRALVTDTSVEFHCMTDLMIYALINYLQSDHLKGVRGIGDLVKRLSKLAWKGIDQRRIVFKPSDLAACGITMSTFEAFLYVYTLESTDFRTRILEGQKRSSFSHLTWQEIFAILHVMLFMNNNEFRRLHSKFANPNFEVVAKFAYGMCNCRVQSEIEQIFPLAVIARYKTDLLKHLAIERAQEGDVITVCSWAKEARNDAITAAVAANLPTDVRLDHTSISPVDASSVTFVILHSDRSYSVDLSDSRFVGNAFALFMSSVEISPRLQNTIKKLNLHRCELTSDDLHHLCAKLDHLANPIEELDLSGNFITSHGVDQISRCVNKITSLNLRGCDLDGDHCRQLAAQIASLNHPLTELNLSDNPKIEDSGALHISKCAPRIRRLIMQFCSISPDGCRHLSDDISKLSPSERVEELNLNGNHIGDVGADFLSKCTENVKRLKLSGCEIGSLGCRSLSTKVASLQLPMHELDLSWNNGIDDESAQNISDFIGHVEWLDLSYCNVGPEGCKKLSEKISSLSTPIEMLDLSLNAIEDVGAEHLVQCVGNVKCLKINRCGISVLQCSKIREVVATLPDPKPDIQGINSEF